MKRVTQVLLWLIPLAMPFFLGFTNIGLLISPAFLRWEYNKASFPADRYGMTRGQRIELATVAVEFLASYERPDQAIRRLEAQTLDGEPLYNQRELNHMVDTKVRTDIMRTVSWVTGAVVVGGTALSASRKKSRRAAWQGLLNGAVVTVVILGAISAYILIDWGSFFTRFHELLFPAGTWTFRYNEALIRLFPEKFWFDVGILLGVGTLVEALVIGAVAFVLGRRQPQGERQALEVEKRTSKVGGRAS
jgi:integral membrane protein (TIGR01906 family)